MKRWRLWLKILSVFCICLCVTGCSHAEEKNPESKSYTIEEILWPCADGVLVDGNDYVQIDYSNTSQGYFMLKTLTESHAMLKLQVFLGEEKYTYDIHKDLEYEVFPFNMGDGTYTIKVYENVEGDQYALLWNTDIEVTLDSEFLPFLYPNQIVDYTQDTACLKKSFELVAEDTTDLERVRDIYNWVIDTITYDYDKLDEIEGKFVLPVLDDVYAKKKGICFDYASLLGAMLRVQHIPTKVVTGMVDEGYHAWVEVYIENMGWIKPHIYFKRGEWTSMDPTYASMDSTYDGPYDVKYTY